MFNLTKEASWGLFFLIVASPMFAILIFGTFLSLGDFNLFSFLLWLVAVIVFFFSARSVLGKTGMLKGYVLIVTFLMSLLLFGFLMYGMSNMKFH